MPAAARRALRSELPEIDDRDNGEGEDAPEGDPRVTRIESAIPPAADGNSPTPARDRLPRPRAFAFAALLAVAVV